MKSFLKIFKSNAFQPSGGNKAKTPGSCMKAGKYISRNHSEGKSSTAWTPFIHFPLGRICFGVRGDSFHLLSDGLDALQRNIVIFKKDGEGKH